MARNQKMVGHRVRGDALGILKTLCESRQPQVLRDQLSQAARMSNLFPTPYDLYQQVSGNPSLQYDSDRGKIVVVQDRQSAAETLATLGRKVVASHFEKDRFILDPNVLVWQPSSDERRTLTGNATAKMLDTNPKPADRVSRLVIHPRVSDAQVATGMGSPPIRAMSAALEGSSPGFTALPVDTGIKYFSKDFTIGEQNLTVVRADRPFGIFGRRVLLAANRGEEPRPYGQAVALVEREYAAIAPEWKSYLPSELGSAAGGLALQEPMEELEQLLAAQDPDVAACVGNATWLKQEIRRLSV